MSEIIYIIDNDNKVRVFPAFIQKMFLKKYHRQGLIQMDKKTKELTICGDVVRWLDKITVETTSTRRADKIMFRYLNKKYPQYKKHIQLF